MFPLMGPRNFLGIGMMGSESLFPQQGGVLGSMGIAGGINIGGMSMGMSLAGSDRVGLSQDILLNNRSSFQHPLMTGGFGQCQGCESAKGMGMIPGMQHPLVNRIQDRQVLKMMTKLLGMMAHLMQHQLGNQPANPIIGQGVSPMGMSGGLGAPLGMTGPGSFGSPLGMLSTSGYNTPIGMAGAVGNMEGSADSFRISGGFGSPLAMTPGVFKGTIMSGSFAAFSAFRL